LSKVIITNWLTATKYKFLKWQRIFSLSTITDKTLPGLTLNNKTGVTLDTGTAFPLRDDDLIFGV
jgi:hypothetical protein